MLVTGGQIVQESCYSHFCDDHPRTAVGRSPDGKTIFLVTVDGRRADADGMTRLELAALMLELGAWDALNLDGGGSTTMFLDGDVVNVPSDGTERVVSSHLGFVPGGDAGCCEPAAVDGASGVFADMADDRWSTPYAEALYDAGITTGCQQNPAMFCPDCVLDRATLAVFLARGLDLPVVAETSFVDVDPGAWYADEVQAIRDAGITTGCAADRYCPDRLATRWEAAAFLWQALGSPDPTGPSRFVDASADQGPALEALAERCVFNGCAADRFCPNDEISREELAKMLAVALSVPPYAPCDPVVAGTDTDASPVSDAPITDVVGTDTGSASGSDAPSDAPSDALVTDVGPSDPPTDRIEPTDDSPVTDAGPTDASSDLLTDAPWPTDATDSDAAPTTDAPGAGDSGASLGATLRPIRRVGCGCASSGASSDALVWLFAAASVARRRRG
jgi:MYXO-CTERM domain-containing protein